MLDNAINVKLKQINAYTAKTQLRMNSNIETHWLLGKKSIQ